MAADLSDYELDTTDYIIMRRQACAVKMSTETARNVLSLTELDETLANALDQAEGAVEQRTDRFGRAYIVLVIDPV